MNGFAGYDDLGDGSPRLQPRGPRAGGEIRRKAEGRRVSYCPLDQVESFLRRFVVYPFEHALKVHTLWIAHCHLMDLWESTPRLAFMSPEPESGKTRALEVTALFVPTPRLSFSMSAASLVRIIAKGHETGAIPTILFDEIDNLFSKSEEGISDLRGALNAGYRRGAVATRCINKGDGIADFLCFSPLAVAGVGRPARGRP